MGFPLSDAEHVAITAMIDGQPELIVAAAIRVDSERVLMTPRPGRHGDCINWLHRLKQPHDDHGFVTNRGRFVGRAEAAQIAIAAVQATPRESCNDLLFSEDVWNDWDDTPGRQALTEGEVS